LPTSCHTYYEQQIKFNRAFEQGNLTQAANHLKNTKKRLYKRNYFLHYANLGLVYSLKGEYHQSNIYLEKAYQFSENHLRNYGDEALSFLTNPNRIQYRPEAHEMLTVNYIKALNNIRLGDLEAALIECRRLNTRLNVLADKVNAPNKYRRDAFINLMMGAIFEASGDMNNAFIFYRNAYNAYEEDFKPMFGIGAPEQLKADLLRSAHKVGFLTELDFYQRRFNMMYQPEQGDGQVVLLWHNGLIPVKDQTFITMTVVKGAGGRVDFVNNEYGFAFPMIWPAYETPNPNRFDNLKFLSIAIPRLVDRPTVFTQGRLETDNGQSITVEKVHDLQQLSHKLLKERLALEIGKGISRLALKQLAAKAAGRGTEAALKKDGKSNEKAEAIGSLVSLLVNIATTVTEKADTRSWQTLPAEVGYTRIFLPAGKHTLRFKSRNKLNNETFTNEIQVEIVPGKTIFHTVNSF
jgi:hypothetical protein